MKIFSCKVCGKEYKRNGLNPKSSFCSLDCKYKFQSTNIRGKNHPMWRKDYQRVKICKNCKKEFTSLNPTTFQKMKFCSKECADIGGFRYSGKEHSNWTGRKTELKRLRCHPKYTRWSKSVLERDNFTCNICERRGGYLHAHHIKSFLKFPEQRFNIDNGITLCVVCHRNLHRLHKAFIENGENSVELFKRQYRAEPRKVEGVEVSPEIMDISTPVAV